MDITGVTFEEMQAVVSIVADTYGGNVELHADARALNSRSFRGRIVTKTSDGPGARRSWSGRRGKWACWHVYRDVMAEAFEINPNARVKASLANYKGQRDFEQSYPATAYKNIGSMVSPAYMPELCDCDE